MINIKDFFKFLETKKINFFTGVPDSILKETNYYFQKKKITNHFITANEGSAIALAIGYFLSTKKMACAYMQNSGLGNAVNPLASIAHEKVYSIPMLLMIGWRGAPGISDEPQHEVKGKITQDILKLLNIKFCKINKYSDLKKLGTLITFAKKNNKPVACLIKKGVLISKKKINKRIKENGISRNLFLTKLLNRIKNKSKLISTTGYTSRELSQIRKDHNIKIGKDFYMVGGMGHASMVANGVSLNYKNDVICLDGDGSFLMHLGSVVNIGKIFKKNFKHILLNNFSHESVGGQTTNIDKFNIKNFVLSAGYKNYFLIDNKKKIDKVLKKFITINGPTLLEVRIKQGSIKNLGRPKNLKKIKQVFMKN
tara:strand:- start:77 stop:1180 length:1104 start_codon:yes stop_codon:yes gene_type:complete